MAAASTSHVRAVRIVCNVAAATAQRELAATRVGSLSAVDVPKSLGDGSCACITGRYKAGWDAIQQFVQKVLTQKQLRAVLPVCYPAQ